jgi:NADPH2:quinone reductase
VLRLDRMADCKKDMRDALSGQGLDGVDVVIDMISGDVFDGAIRCLRPGGRLVVVGFASGRIAEAKTNYLLLKGISVVGSALIMGLDQDGPLLKRLMDRVYRDVAADKLDPFITGTFPIDQFHQAAAQIAERTAAGKIVLIPPRAG